VGPAELAQARRSWQRGPARRAQLAEAAAQQFYRLGFYRVSMADVAAAVGVTAPAIYRYFGSKQELLAAAIGSGLDAVAEALDRAAGHRPPGPVDLAAARAASAEPGAAPAA
jgi:AcrR family transcriptional regulator